MKSQANTIQDLNARLEDIRQKLAALSFAGLPEKEVKLCLKGLNLAYMTAEDIRRVLRTQTTPLREEANRLKELRKEQDARRLAQKNAGLSQA